MPGTYFKKGSFSEIDLAYLAGILDGEGCITISKYKSSSCKQGYSYQIRVQVATKDPIITAECLKITGFGRVNKKQYKTGFLYIWCTEAVSAYNVLKLVLPYLRLKTKQAEACISLYEFRLSKKQNYLSDSDLEYRDQLYEECKNLKKDIYAGHVL